MTRFRREGAPRRDRGQLLLAGSVAVAVVFIGLVVVLNAGLYTANVSPRAGVDSAGDAGTAIDSARRDVGTLVVASSYRVVDGRTYLHPSRLADNLTAYEEYYGAAVASTGNGAVTVSLNGTTTGSHSLVAQTDRSRAFTSPGGAENWTVVSDAGELTEFNVTVLRFPVHRAQNATARVVVDDGTDRWRLSTYWDNPRNEARVLVEEPDGTVTDCVFPQSGRRNDTGVRVDISGGEIHAPCADGDDSFRPPDETLSGDYDVRFVHDGPGATDRMTGTYGFVTDGDPHAGFAGDVGPAPFVVPELESATADVAFYSASVDAETTVTVTPNDGLPFALASPPTEGFDTVPGTAPDSGGLAGGTGLVAGGMTFATGAGDRVATLAENGQAAATYNATGVVAVGSQRADFDGDGYPDAAFVDGAGRLSVVDGNDAGPRTLASGAADRRFVVTDWGGSLSVYYTTSSGQLRRAAPGEPSTVVPGVDASAVAGAGDVDGDGAEELVYVDDSAGAVRYLELDGSVSDGGPSVAGPDAVGRPFDADGDGDEEVPFFDGSEIALYDEDGVDSLGSTAGEATATSLGVLDLDLDSDEEVVYVDADGELRAVDVADDAASAVVDDDGDPVAADGGAGVA
ncbi:hypothetical protein [Halogeometricum luteum]|uniref:VCBS repeat-containing protein n=1 Tax=Halogeometricum luteum TaxID=2950537 RepID=A0ABU2FX77_9EURY|nr:hypothetical protein [Halogeometricum sp. S3BR5-2]MDS0293146.1 hypothetical protein [Halogeometricum sp. S3BR5-2]